MGKISAILFDFGGTLDGPVHWLDRSLAHYRAAGINIARAELDPAFADATRIGYGATRILSRFGLIDLVRFLIGHQVEYLLKSGPPNIRAMLNEGGTKGRHRIVEAITTSFIAETRAGLEHSREVMAALSGGFKLGVVSNFYGNLDRVLADARLERYFAAVSDSSRVGIFKPEPGIYQDALKKLRTGPVETAMVGDSLSKDCAPAKSLGMRTVWLRADSSRALAQNADSLADVTIESLDEVARIAW